jgi:hypothetical protein
MSPERVEGGPAEAKRRRVVQGTTPLQAWGLHKIANLKFEKLWVLVCDWSRSGILDENSQMVKKWLDNYFKLEFAEEFDGLWIFRYAKHKF